MTFLYRALLRLLPTSFRNEYGREMESDFAGRRAEAPGMLAGAVLLLEAIADVTTTAIRVHSEILAMDLRYAARALARAPGFAITAILVVALGVGANTAAFSVADLVLLKPLPYSDSGRLVRLWQTSEGYGQMELSPANWRDWRDASTSFEGLGIYINNAANLTGRGEPLRVDGAALTTDVLPMLGVQPVIGRAFTEDEGEPDAANTVLLSHGLWQSHFGGEPGIVGTTVQLDGIAYEVIGIMPRGFAFPRRDVALWTAVRFAPDDFLDRTNNYLYGIGKLRPGVSLEAARAEMGVITSRLAEQYPESNEGSGANVFLLKDSLSGQTRMLLLALCGASLCILLIACANLASLLLARAMARQRELAVRTALGAGRERLVRQLVTESVLLALLGGALGLTVAFAAVPLLGQLVPESLPVSGAPSLDLRVLLLAGLITGLTGLGFGVVPALRASGRLDLTALRDGARTAGGRQRLRSVLVASEVTASVVLLVAAGLLLRAMWNIQSVDPGFRTDSVITMRTALPLPKYAITSTRLAFYNQVLEGVERLPGVRRAAYISYLPMTMTGGIWPVITEGQASERRDGNRSASLRFATTGLFETLNIPLRRGRLIADTDTRETPFVAVVSESFVERFFPGVDPLGRRMTFGLLERTVVGVVADIRVRGLERTSEPQVYLPAAQVEDNWLVFYVPKDLAVYAEGNVEALVPAIRGIIHAADPEQPISSISTMDGIVNRQTASREAQLRLLAALALLAFVLAGVGIHGVLSYTVSSRAQEFGIRMALGARPGDIVRMVVRQGATLALVGMVPGVFAAWAAGRAMASLLVDVHPADAATYGVVIVLCVAMALAGCLLPALRAVKVDPLSAIKAD